jgi:hypothetical protein
MHFEIACLAATDAVDNDGAAVSIPEENSGALGTPCP